MPHFVIFFVQKIHLYKLCLSLYKTTLFIIYNTSSFNYHIVLFLFLRLLKFLSLLEYQWSCKSIGWFKFKYEVFTTYWSLNTFYFSFKFGSLCILAYSYWLSVGASLRCLFTESFHSNINTYNTVLQWVTFSYHKGFYNTLGFCWLTTAHIEV